jgi:hypothetical protein
MKATKEAGVLGIFTELDAATETIKKLRKAGHKEIVVYSPLPRHELEHALEPAESPVRIFTLVGALTGAAAGFGLAIGTSLDWPLMTGGKPIISVPAFVAIGFEVTVLLGALSTVVGLFLNARLPHLARYAVYDPSFSVGRFGVFVAIPAEREGEVKAVMTESGAHEVRVQPTEVRVGNV